jgi:uncharacterized membrane protein
VERKVKNIFWWLLLIAGGVLFIFLLPPFQKYDEVGHFYRAVALARGQIVCGNDSFIIPKDLKDLHIKYNFQKVLLENEKFPINNVNLLERRDQNKKITEKADVCNLSFFGYIPNAVGVLIGELTDRPAMIFYLGRIFGFIFFLLVFRKSLKIVDLKFRFLLWFYALTPLVLHQVTAFSYDVVVLSLVLPLTALLVKRLQGQRWSRGQWRIIWFLVIVLGLIKIVYFPLILIFLLIDFDKSKEKFAYILRSSVWLVLASTTVFVFMKILAGSIPYNMFVNPTIQKRLIINDPWYFVTVLERTFHNNWFEEYKNMVAVFGWKNAQMSNEFGFYIYLLVAGLVIVNLAKRLKHQMKIGLIIMGFAIMAGVYFLIQLAMYLTWSVVGSEMVLGTQGRYYLPILPFALVFLVFGWKFVEEKWWRKLIFFGLVAVFIFYSIANGLYIKYFDNSRNYSNLSALNEEIKNVKKGDVFGWVLLDKKTEYVQNAEGVVSGFKINLDNRNKAILIPYRFEVMDGDCQRVMRYGYLRMFDIQGNIIYLQEFDPIKANGSMCLRLTPLTFGLKGYEDSFLSVKTKNGQWLESWLEIK